MSIQEVTVYVGVDVASKHLDLYFPDSGKSQRIKNDAQAIVACMRKFITTYRLVFNRNGKSVRLVQ
jgi:hypothetical protein